MTSEQFWLKSKQKGKYNINNDEAWLSKSVINLIKLKLIWIKLNYIDKNLTRIKKEIWKNGENIFKLKLPKWHGSRKDLVKEEKLQKSSIFFLTDPWFKELFLSLLHSKSIIISNYLVSRSSTYAQDGSQKLNFNG